MTARRLAASLRAPSKNILVVVLALSMVACVVRRVEITPLSMRAPVTVTTPVKAHLTDGSTVVYPNGLTVTAEGLQGAGTRYDVTLATQSAVQSIPMAEVIGLESFSTRVDGQQSALLTLGAVAGTALLAPALLVAIFGSCPTVYSAGGVEEAELFSNSIAPLFEGRDLDRLRATADADGIVSLEIRNEAMETHYINHLQLLEVSHASGETVVPDHEGTPLIVGRDAPISSAVNRDGLDVRNVLAASDNRFYSTDPARLAAARADDMQDWIDVTVPVEPGATSAAISLRMRNSLLSTILLYDVMLGSAGASAIDWLGNGLQNIGTAVELSRWHQKRAGLHLSVWQDGAWRSVARMPDSGPISWHDVAAVLPVPSGETQLRVRLSYLADHWRIDKLGVSFSARPGAPRVVPVSSVAGRDGTAETPALENMRAPDDRYLQTRPGQTFVARFDAGQTAPSVARTFLLSSQGYYIEWIRRAWIEKATTTEPFVPSDAALTAMRKWAQERTSFEHRFFTSRVPVR